MSRRKKEGLSGGGRLMILSAFLLLLAAFLFYINNRPSYGGELVWRDTGVEAETGYDGTARFRTNGGDFFFLVTKDGVRCLSSAGEPRWQDTFTLTNPHLAGKGPVLAVGDARGNGVHVYDAASGPLYRVVTDDPILFFSVNEAGLLAVVLRQDAGYAVQVHDAAHTVEPLYANLIRDAARHPSAVGLSADGTSVAIALTDVSVRLSAQVLFCYMNQTDAWNTQNGDGVFAIESFPDQIPYRVEYLSGGRVLVATDTALTCYRLGEANAVTLLWRHEMHNEVSHLAVSDRLVAYATGEPRLNDPLAGAPGLVRLLDMEGQETGAYALSQPATFLSVEHGCAVAGAGRAFVALGTDGAPLWEFDSLRDADGLWMLQDTDTVLLAAARSAAVWKRERVRETERIIFEQESSEPDWTYIGTGAGTVEAGEPDPYATEAGSWATDIPAAETASLETEPEEGEVP